MKILFIRTAEKFSGAEEYNVMLLPEIKKNNKLNIYFLTNLESLQKELENKDITSRFVSWLPVEVGTNKQLLSSVIASPVFIFKYLVLFNKFRPEVVCFESRTEKIFLTPIAKLMGYKVVWIEHGPLYQSEASGFVKWLYKLSSNFVTKIIAVSQSTKNDLVKGGIWAKKVVVIYIGSNVKKRNKLGNQFTIGFIGTLTREKGTDEFVEIARELQNIFNFVVIGDGPELKSMKTQINAEFTGFVQNINPFLSKIDLLLFPTRHNEGISMAILEAQAMGVPVVTTDLGGNKEIIQHRINGLIYKTGDVDRMVKGIKYLASNKRVYDRMSQAAYKIITEKFNIIKQANKFTDLFLSI